jgi:hypothetical protein
MIEERRKRPPLPEMAALTAALSGVGMATERPILGVGMGTVSVIALIFERIGSNKQNRLEQQLAHTDGMVEQIIMATEILEKIKNVAPTSLTTIEGGIVDNPTTT